MTAQKTLFVVEDNDVARIGLATLLGKKGFTVPTATNGREALDYLTTHPAPDVILLDMLLPVLDDWMFLEEIKRLKLTPRPHIIITTGTTIIGREWAEAHGCTGLVRKPVDMENLLAEIRRCLGSK